MRNNLKALRYTIAVFVVLMFLWWFQGGHLISFLRPNPAPSEVVVLGTANALKWTAANVFNLIENIFQ